MLTTFGCIAIAPSIEDESYLMSGNHKADPKSLNPLINPQETKTYLIKICLQLCLFRVQIDRLIRTVLVKSYSK
jgi:hypothetical protein